MGPCVWMMRSTNEAVFEAYAERALAPALRPRRVVIDNLSPRKGERVRESIEGRGGEMLYLPPYSQDLIEESFFKI